MKQSGPVRGIQVILALAALPLFARPAEAQVRFGPQLSYATSDGIDHGFGIGARVQFPILGDFQSETETTAAGALAAVITLDRFFPDCDGCAIWEANANGVLPLLVIDAFVPYVGAGVRISRLSGDSGAGVEDLSDNDFGLNLLAGVRHSTSRLFGEIRGGVVGDNNPLAFTVGVSFGGGGGGDPAVDGR